ncbi:MAG: dihydrodipicolinate synthase family protein [Rhodospirillales bacterium]|jgi:4-hydroxy-tetrahydrodipicolinate synthase|nr:dihydrodipicolinate synthase family protein [Rhodospirillales bacterium]MDP6803897.1 dihydrodipicolinate synthase family protein [Rhodospirillales bacterium]
MDKNSVAWKDLWVAIVTPFDAAGAIDEDALRTHVGWCIAEGVSGIVAAGCTGEFWALTDDERNRVIKVCVEAAGGQVPVIGGTGAIRTPDVIALTEAAKGAGCAGVMVLPPFFVKPSTDDIVAHYQAVSDAVDIPILLYNIPGNAVNALVPELVDRLADIDNVVAIKESSMDFTNYTRTLDVAGDRLRVFGFSLAGRLIGAAGAIETNPNFWASGLAEIHTAYTKGDIERARALNRTAIALRDLTIARDRNMYCSVKAIMAMFGLSGGVPRLPLRPLAEPHLAELRQGLVDLGLMAGKEAAAQ